MVNQPQQLNGGVNHLVGKPTNLPWRSLPPAKHGNGKLSFQGLTMGLQLVLIRRVDNGRNLWVDNGHLRAKLDKPWVNNGHLEAKLHKPWVNNRHFKLKLDKPWVNNDYVKVKLDNHGLTMAM